jgi:hypothetical protein
MGRIFILPLFLKKLSTLGAYFSELKISLFISSPFSPISKGFNVKETSLLKSPSS